MNKRWQSALVIGLVLVAVAAFGATARSSGSNSGGTLRLGTSSRIVAHIKRASATDATTLVVQYTKAPGNVLGQFQQFAILPQHIWSKYTKHKGNDLKTFSNVPLVGAGPFKLVKFSKNDIALFQR